MSFNVKKCAAVMGVVAALAVTASCDANKPSAGSAAEKDWPTIGGGLGNMRYSPLKQINTENVKTLGPAWRQTLAAAESSSAERVRGGTVVVGNRMYAATTSQAFALDAATGDVVWASKLPGITAALFKGPSVGDGMMFVGLGDSRVVGINAETGAVVWETMTGDGKDRHDEPGTTRVAASEYIAGGLIYADGVVVAGLSNGDHGIQGRVIGLDGKTGKELWRFNTTPVDANDPASKTWSKEFPGAKGGGGIWSVPAVDTDLGLVYLGVGNARPQYAGEARAGDNLYTTSAIALDLKTGKLKWHYQVVRHDIWEADLGTPLVLYDAKVNGKTHKAVAVISTNGYLFLLDRVTGKPLYPIEERAVPQNERQKTVPTQPFPVGADQVGNRCVDPDSVPKGWLALCMYDPIDQTMPNALYPILSTRAAPMAYSPQTNAFYATAADWPSWIRRSDDPEFFLAGPLVPGTKYKGILAAVDASTNKLLWKKFVPYRTQQNGSGFMATAGGLLLRGSTDGLMEAYNQANGDLIWTFQTGADANRTVGTYEIAGTQYVSVASGQNVWAFKLGGAAFPEQPAPPSTAREPEVTGYAGRIVATTDIIMGPVINDTGLLGKPKQMKDEYAFGPTRAKVERGSKVTWVNEGQETHDATATDGSWTTGPIAPGAKASVIFKDAGTFNYTDTLHPWQFGQIIVEE